MKTCLNWSKGAFRNLFQLVKVLASRFGPTTLICWQHIWASFLKLENIAYFETPRNFSDMSSKTRKNVLFLGNYLRNRMWTLNFLPKSDSFSTFSGLHWVGESHRKVQHFPTFRHISIKFSSKFIHRIESSPAFFIGLVGKSVFGGLLGIVQKPRWKRVTFG